MEHKIESIKEELRKGNIDKAVKLLVEATKLCYKHHKEDEGFKKLYNSAIVTSSRLSELKDKRINGVWNDTEDSPKKNQIVQTIMEIADKISNNTKLLKSIIPNDDENIGEAVAASPQSSVKNEKTQEEKNKSVVNFELTIDGELDKFTVEEQLRTLKIIEELSNIAPLKIRSIREGSIIIVFETTQGEAEILLALIQSGRLKNLKISKGKLLGESELFQTSGNQINNQRIKVYQVIKWFDELEGIIVKFIKNGVLNLKVLNGPILNTVNEINEQVRTIEVEENQIPEYFSNDISLAKIYLNELLSIIGKALNIKNLLVGTKKEILR